MALTVRPDDEVYQFDTVWLGPDEYTLPIQARYVAWGTWLACFLAACAILIPIGGHGPGGVLGSLMWSIAVSVVAARAVMLVVDHERPLRSLPQVFSAEARAAMVASRGAERSMLLRFGRVRVREVPEKVVHRRERERQALRRRAERKAAGRGPGRRGRAQGVAMASPVEDYLPAIPPPERAGPIWSGTAVPYPATAPYPDWDEAHDRGGYGLPPTYDAEPVLVDESQHAYDPGNGYPGPVYEGVPVYDPGPVHDAAPGYDTGYHTAGYGTAAGYDPGPGYDTGPAYGSGPAYRAGPARHTVPGYEAGPSRHAEPVYETTPAGYDGDAPVYEVAYADTGERRDAPAYPPTPERYEDEPPYRGAYEQHRARLYDGAYHGAYGNAGEHEPAHPLPHGHHAVPDDIAPEYEISTDDHSAAPELGATRSGFRPNPDRPYPDHPGRGHAGPGRAQTVDGRILLPARRVR